MRVTLVTLQDDLNCYGLRALSSILRARGIETRMVFLDRFGPHGAAKAYRGEVHPFPTRVLDEVVEVCRGSDVVGFSVMTLYYRESARLSDHVRSALGVPIVWGGIHPICFPEECLAHADVVCLGEAEETFPEVIERIVGGGSLDGVPGAWWRDGGGVRRNPSRSPLKDLDTCPAPDVTTEGHFVQRRGRLVPLDRKELLQRWSYHYMTINARGCPLHCTYCCNSQLANRFDFTTVRKKSVPVLMAELKGIVSRYPEIAGIKLSDDAFGDLPADYIREFAASYKREIGLPLGIPGFSPFNMTEDKLAPLVEAGLVYTRLGIQSGSPRVRKLYGRHDTDDQIVNAVSLVQRHRPRIQRLKLDMITDCPWEEDDDIVATIRLLQRLPRPYSLAVFSLTLFPGTPLYLRARREKLVSDGDPRSYDSHFYNFDRKHPLNRVIALFKKDIVLDDRIDGLVDSYRDPARFERRYRDYLAALPINWKVWETLRPRPAASMW